MEGSRFVGWQIYRLLNKRLPEATQEMIVDQLFPSAPRDETPI